VNFRLHHPRLHVYGSSSTSLLVFSVNLIRSQVVSDPAFPSCDVMTPDQHLFLVLK